AGLEDPARAITPETLRRLAEFDVHAQVAAAPDAQNAAQQLFENYNARLRFWAVRPKPHLQESNGRSLAGTSLAAETSIRPVLCFQRLAPRFLERSYLRTQGRPASIARHNILLCGSRASAMRCGTIPASRWSAMSTIKSLRVR